MDPEVNKYLARHARSEVAIAEDIDGSYEHVVVIPAIAEDAGFLDGLRPALGDSRALVILVVNATDSRLPAEHTANTELLNQLGSDGRPWLVQRERGQDLLVIDRASPGRRLARGEGVGLARKIGCDVALALSVQGKVKSSWIHTTDADVTLPADYLESSVPIRAAGLTYRFWHECDYQRPSDRALALYEISLRYYVVGLKSAGSPYGVHTIGSTLAIDGSTYARVRGFPRREAGEDFYLVNKARKLGPIATPTSAPVSIRSRSSSRTPFGTGPAVQKLEARIAAGEEPRLYHPESFELLRIWLRWLSEQAEHDTLSFEGLDLRLRLAASAIGAPEALATIASTTSSPRSRRRRFLDWFDGFRTLKLIHALRDSAVGTVPWREGLASMGGPHDDLESARLWLAARDDA